MASLGFPFSTFYLALPPPHGERQLGVQALREMRLKAMKSLVSSCKETKLLGIKRDDWRDFCIFAPKFGNMKILINIKIQLLRIVRSQVFKYTVVCAICVLFIGFLDENSMWSHMKNLQRIEELTEETARYQADYQRDQAQIRELNKNPKAIEKIARERYFMKEDDEDIFVLSDDERVPQKIIGSNEGAE